MGFSYGLGYPPFQRLKGTNFPGVHCGLLRQRALLDAAGTAGAVRKAAAAERRPGLAGAPGGAAAAGAATVAAGEEDVVGRSGRSGGWWETSFLLHIDIYICDETV